MIAVQYSSDAERDLRDIHAYLYAHEPNAARRVLLRIKTTAGNLAQLPEMGKKTEEFTAYKMFVSRYPYCIVYTYDAAAHEVTVIAVFHTAQDRNI